MSEKIINVLQFVLGVTFNLALVALIVFGVYTFVQRGLAFGAEFAGDMVYVGPDHEIEFILEEDTPAAEVARMLADKGIIHNQWLFRLELFLKGSTRVYRAGTYTLNTNMSNTAVNVALRQQPPPEVPHNVITIPEGWTVRDIAIYLESREEFDFTAEEFIEEANTGFFNFHFLTEVPNRNVQYRLEGYLFPDTYFVSLSPTPREVLNNMLQQFQNVFDAEQRARAEYLGLTMDEVVIMASIIEREARVASERPLVSQVIHNRLDIGMMLQMCSTVAYVLDVQRDRLTFADLEVQSPFNTYRHAGLPIGPISNPGRASINAALWPSEGNYLFFVLINPDTGEHYFSRTFAEHLAADQAGRIQSTAPIN